MLGFLRKADLDALETRVRQLEVDWKAQVAALENAADLYNKAAHRRDVQRRTAQKLLEGVDVGPGGGLDEIRRRRGGF
jgi:hypothetical protein